jgi:CheY-like chemotaxis protein/HPt (histidine-containing phosphotransfer) domain-containing protein
MAAPLERILYVEDEPDIRTIALAVLRKRGGYEVTACASGREAIAAAPTARADLILLDVMMPGMDGPTTLAALRELPETAATPVIFMTAKVMSADVAHLRGLGALEVIAKPFDPLTLAQQVARAWEGRDTAPGKHAARDAELAPFREGFAVRVPEMVAEIEALWSRVRVERDAAALEALHRALHSLAGSGRTFGFGALGEAARALEQAIAPSIGEGVPATAALDAMAPLVEGVRRAASGGKPAA